MHISPKQAVVAQNPFGAGLNSNKQCLTIFYVHYSGFFIRLNGCKLDRALSRLSPLSDCGCRGVTLTSHRINHQCRGTEYT